MKKVRSNEAPQSGRSRKLSPPPRQFDALAYAAALEMLG